MIFQINDPKIKCKAAEQVALLIVTVRLRALTMKKATVVSASKATLGMVNLASQMVCYLNYI